MNDAVVNMKCPVCCFQTAIGRSGLHVCPRCGHGYRPYADDILLYHEEEYRRLFHRGPNEFAEDGAPLPQFHKKRKKIVRQRIRLIREFLHSGDSCLDIGAGGGTFSRAVSDRVASVDCTEVEPNLAQECERLGFSTRRGDFLNMDFTQSYDVVFAWHVLEHVEDIHAFVKKALSLARKYFILEIPYQRNVPKIFDGHLHYFTETSLRFLLMEQRIVTLLPGVQKPALMAVLKGAPNV